MMTDITIRPLAPEDWAVLERLFGPNGACGGCWCMWWRVEKGGKTFEAAKGEPNRQAMRRLVEDGRVHGLLAFDGNEPVGWCSFGPKRDFPRLLRSRALARSAEADTWAVVCFYIRSKYRHQGVASQLAEVATRRCFELGAREIEAYPVVSKSPGREIPAAFAWTGVPPLFDRQGYARQDRPEGARPIYVKFRADPE